jgi:hypothetical protein
MERLRLAHEGGRLRPLYEGLSALGSVPWRVNTRVLAVMERVVAEGERPGWGLLVTTRVSRGPADDGRMYGTAKGWRRVLR